MLDNSTLVFCPHSQAIKFFLGANSSRIKDSAMHAHVRESLWPLVCQLDDAVINMNQRLICDTTQESHYVQQRTFFIKSTCIGMHAKLTFTLPSYYLLQVGLLGKASYIFSHYATSEYAVRKRKDTASHSGYQTKNTPLILSSTAIFRMINLS